MLEGTMQTVLTIAGFDPSSGAGVTADLMVFRAHGLFGVSCITGLTVQSTLGVKGTVPVSVGIVHETLDCLQSDLPLAGIKIGMLATAANVAMVSDFLEMMREVGRRAPVVLDPVLRSSSGRELLDAEGVAVMRRRLLPLVDWVTPNMDELGVLSGHLVGRREDMPAAARVLQKMGDGLNVVATGGHLDTPDDLLLLNGAEIECLTGEKIISKSTHGTGCAFSSALLSRIVLGDPREEVASLAKKYVAEAIRTATELGHGVGPVNHLWPLQDE
jgi:hydroxymethylpyrimidine/phosphomethylpyrimidine kinase